jgi:FixJ family two-component response regulator
LAVSVRTVEGHRRMMFSKMPSSAAQLVRTVLRAREAARAWMLDRRPPPA